ncbi:MAG TPA: OmpA family protein, partial [Saprospiraceae bacterium]|nr:OmpA family protein [Saprospiraceae bacterium]
QMLFGQWSVNKEAILSAKLQNCQNVNSKGNEYCPLIFKNQVYFVSDYNAKGKYTDQFDLYYFDGNKGKKMPMPANINSLFHEGPMGKTKDHLVFTRSTPTTEVEVIQYNPANNSTVKLTGALDLNLSVLHPTFDEAGGRMIATIPIVDSIKSHTDLKMWEGKNTKFPTIKKLEGINSTANDCFPRLINDSILIFASDRAGGYGGLDLYVSFYSDDAWQTPLHLPEPINGPADDFGLVLNADMKKGYLNSSRPGGKGGDDIYLIQSKNSLFDFTHVKQNLTFDFEILDILTFLPIQDAFIKILPIKHDSTLTYLAQQNLELVNTSKELKLNNVIADQLSSALLFKTDSLGISQPTLEIDPGYFIEVAIPNYQRQYLLHIPERLDTIQEIVMVLSPESIAQDSVPRPISQGQRFAIQGLTFDENKLIIEDFAEDFLSDLSSAMKAYSTMLIQLIGYTDARGNAVQNFRKSQARAENLKKYLIEQGVESDRIITLGEGENKILNQCTDGVECLDYEHNINNRIEISCISD